MTGKTWAEVAAALDVSVSAMMMVKTGRRGISDKVLFRLAQAEVRAGIETPATNDIPFGILKEKEKRTGQPYEHFMSKADRDKSIVSARKRIAQDEALISTLKESIKLSRDEIKFLEGLD